MYSSLYYYFQIRNDKNYSKSVPTEVAVKVLEETGVLHRKGPQKFKNVEGYPWLDISCVYTKDGNYNSERETLEVNLIIVVVSNSNSSDQRVSTELLVRIAKEINWELILEEDENGNSDLVLFSPNGAFKERL